MVDRNLTVYLGGDVDLLVDLLAFVGPDVGHLFDQTVDSFVDLNVGQLVDDGVVEVRVSLVLVYL